MRKLFFTTVLTAFAISATNAQVITKQLPVKKNTTIKPIPSQPAPAPAPAPAPPPPPSTQQPVAKQAPAASDLVYSLTSVRANIRTGNDNKEYPSSVRTTLGVRGSRMEYSYFVQDKLQNEMRSNSNTEFGLEKITSGNFKDISMDALQNAGLELRISYGANFQLDAWKIEGVSVTLEFRDQYGNLHPTLAQKTITFNNANGFLNGYSGTTTMICAADGYLNPLSAYIN
ncbi:MAG: hypothetical protein ACXWC7_13305 [Chitinophagaceae bacterium]